MAWNLRCPVWTVTNFDGLRQSQQNRQDRRAAIETETVFFGDKS
jgi:hypothetical protein